MLWLQWLLLIVHLVTAQVVVGDPKSGHVGAPKSGECPGYSSHSKQYNGPFSTGNYHLSYQRPRPACRTFNSTGVEKAIRELKQEIYDPDLFRLFENTYPNTLDTAIRWKGVASNNSDEELCFIITGDINAMWIRDSANQVAPYKTVLRNKTDDIASVFRGTINLQARYLIQFPYCNSFLPPEESGINSGTNGAWYSVYPPYDEHVVFTCNFELDDFGGFLQLSHDYYTKTGDLDFFGKFQWIQAVQSIMSASNDMRQPTLGPNGEWLRSPYTFQSRTEVSTRTLGMHGIGSPVNYTGMVRSPFRPSDDAAIYDFGIAANMMLSRYLASTSEIMSKLPNAPRGLAEDMKVMADGIREGITNWGIVTAPHGQKIYAYEVDGYGGRNLMDDANVPSLLSAPFLGYCDVDDPTYQRTRKFVLSRMNPWWGSGSVMNGIGSPHIRPDAPWPMSNIIRALTTDNYWEIYTAIREIVSSTDGLGLIHESVDSNDQSRWTREWYVL